MDIGDLPRPDAQDRSPLGDLRPPALPTSAHAAIEQDPASDPPMLVRERYRVGQRVVYLPPFREFSRGLQLATAPELVFNVRWRQGIWRVGEIEGGEWIGGRLDPYRLRCRGFTVIEELPAWRHLGPNGAAVLTVIDRASQLTREEVGLMPDHMPDGLPDPRPRFVHEVPQEPLAMALWNARAYVEAAVEDRAHDIAPETGHWTSFDGRDVWELVDPFWRRARAAGASAAEAAVLGEARTAREREGRGSAWQRIVGPA
jgi:hypothetical protein